MREAYQKKLALTSFVHKWMKFWSQKKKRKEKNYEKNPVSMSV
jgi:hypothetical protein